MGKQILVIGLLFLLLIASLSGCQEPEQTAITYEGIELESSVVELVNASLEYHYKEGTREVVKIDAHYLFHNIAGRTIDRLIITAEFLDKEDNLVAMGGPKILNNFPKDYTEQYDPNFNTISYEGPNVDKINHIIIIAEEEATT